MRSAESLAEVFVEIADALMAEVDVEEFLHAFADRCRQLPRVGTAGLVLADPKGRLQATAAADERARLLTALQVQHQEGPALECHRTGETVMEPAIPVAAGRWPRFAPACRRAGFAAVHAAPMRHRDRVIGALTLFQAGSGLLDPATARIARALTDATTIALLQRRTVRDQHARITQLQAALTSRVVIEQAKGVLAERLTLDVEQAFTVLRRHARTQNYRLAELARAVVDGTDGIPWTAPGTDGP